MRIVVTGGCGFIGSHIVDELIIQGHEVLVIDNLSTGSIDNLNSKVEMLQAEFSGIQAQEAIVSFRPEIVFHHAAQVSVQHSMENPIEDANSNILGTIALLSVCKNVGVKKFIYPSSAAVYGNPIYLPVNEEHPINPVSFYGISKYVPEHYIRVFCNECDMEYAILRYANVYGERQGAHGEGGVVSVFLNKTLNNEDVVIYGNGEQTRDFIYIKDIVTANIFVMYNGYNEVFNVSTGEEVSINNLFSVMSRIYKFEEAPMYKDQREGDIMYSFLDNSKLCNLGWQPNYNISEGIRSIYAQCSSQSDSKEAKEVI